MAMSDDDSKICDGDPIALDKLAAGLDHLVGSAVVGGAASVTVIGATVVVTLYLPGDAGLMEPHGLHVAVANVVAQHAPRYNVSLVLSGRRKRWPTTTMNPSS